MPTISDLRQRQALPLNAKVLMSQNRIREWYQHFDGDVCVSFSGGKDSTVLAYLVHDIYPGVPLVFSDTGLEFPEIRQFARKMGAVFVRPQMRFDEVISTYGYPLISKAIASSIFFARKIIKTTVGKDEINARDSVPYGEKTAEYQKRMLLGKDGISKDGEIHPSVRGGTYAPCGRRAQLLGKVGISEKRKGLICEGLEAVNISSIFNKEKWLPLCQETQFVISDKCCAIMKKKPLKKYYKQNKLNPLIGTLTEESKMREQAWLKNGCNAFESSEPTSQPLSFWTEQDVLKYIKQKGIEIANVYGDIVCTDEYGFYYEPIQGVDCRLKCTGCQRTGCVYCGFGAHHDAEKTGETRFQRLAKTHPKQYEYCMGGGQWVDNQKYDPSAPKMDGEWKNWNPKKIWVPSKKGLGMKKVFDDCNEIYGKDFIRYE